MSKDLVKTQIDTDITNKITAKSISPLNVGNNMKAIVDLIPENTTTQLYKVYTALLSQSGTNIPTAIVLENTLGGTIIWSYSNTGVFYGTLIGTFVLNKTTVLNNISNGGVHITAIRSSNDQIQIQSRDMSGTNINGAISSMTIEIRVYN